MRLPRRSWAAMRRGPWGGRVRVLAPMAPPSMDVADILESQNPSALEAGTRDARRERFRGCGKRWFDQRRAAMTKLWRTGRWGLLATVLATALIGIGWSRTGAR